MDTIYRRLSDLHLSVRCEKCEKPSPQKVLHLLEHGKVLCPYCRALAVVDVSALKQKIAAAQQLRDAKRAEQPTEQSQ